MFPDDDDAHHRSALNARGALTCANSTVTSRLRPMPASMTAVVGRPMDLAVLNIRCAVPNGNVTVTVSPGGQTVTLRDDGARIDQQTGDGIYSGHWTPAAQGRSPSPSPAPTSSPCRCWRRPTASRRCRSPTARSPARRCRSSRASRRMITSPFPLRSRAAASRRSTSTSAAPSSSTAAGTTPTSRRTTSRCRRRSTRR